MKKCPETSLGGRLKGLLNNSSTMAQTSAGKPASNLWLLCWAEAQAFQNTFLKFQGPRLACRERTRTWGTELGHRAPMDSGTHDCVRVIHSGKAAEKQVLRFAQDDKTMLV